MSDIDVRGFREGDRTALRELFSRAGEGSPGASLWDHAEAEAELYLDPYMDLEPESLFVATSDGELVGYLTGSQDGSKLPSEAARLKQVMSKHRLILRRKTAGFFARSIIDAARCAVHRTPMAGELDDPRWPAHLHINVAPEVRGRGVGNGLMRQWMEWLHDTGSPGCFLQTLVENDGAVRFFERLGFDKIGPTPLVPGMRYLGKHVHQQTMVRTTPGVRSAG